MAGPPNLCPGYRSATEYSVQDDQADAITRIAAYHRRQFSYSVIWFPDREHNVIRQSIATTFQRPPVTATTPCLGSLGQLPTELLHDMVLRLDMHAVFKLRQTSLGARDLVDSLTQYRIVASLALRAFCALLRTGFAMHVSLGDFYDTLTTETCAICGRFGGFVYFLTWTRYCFDCLEHHASTDTQTLANVQSKLHLKKAELSRVKQLKTLPGIYSLEERLRKSRVTIISTQQLDLQIGHYLRIPPDSPMQRNFAYRYMASCALPYYDKRARKAQNGLSCSGCQLAYEKFSTFSIRASMTGHKVRDRQYTQDGFLEHFRWCEQAQLLWRSSGEGQHSPAELPEFSRLGGCFNRRD